LDYSSSFERKSHDSLINESSSRSSQKNNKSHVTILEENEDGLGFGDNISMNHLLSESKINAESDYDVKNKKTKYYLFKTPTKIFSKEDLESFGSDSRKRKRFEYEEDDDKMEPPKRRVGDQFFKINVSDTVTPVKRAVRNTYNLVKNQLFSPNKFIEKDPLDFYERFIGTGLSLNETLWSSNNSRYKLLMIIGNQKMKVYEVPLTWKSLSSHAAYVLDYGGETFIQFIGSKCSADERLYSASICSKLKKRDYFGRGNIFNFEEEEALYGQSFILDIFWETLGLSNTSPEYKKKKIEKNNERLVNVIEDERNHSFVESLINVYNVNNETKSLDLIHEGSLPNHNILNSNSVIILDAFSEVYLWRGSRSPLETRNLGVSLTKYLYKNHPLYKRPSWAILEKISENFEPVLFTEKFCDHYVWDDSNGSIVYS
jgi:hypothetical protein